MAIPLAPPLPANAAGPEHYLIEGAVPADRGNGIVLNLGTAILTPESLTLHIGFRNMGVNLIPSYGGLTEADYHLSEGASLSEIEATAISSELRFISPPDGLPPRLANYGTITFPVPASLSDLHLRVYGFAPIPFSLGPDSRFTPNAAAEEFTVTLPETVLHSPHEHLSIFPIHVSRIHITSGAIAIDLEFENASNRSFFLNTAGISGSDAFLVDANFQSHKPTAISSSLRESIGPVGKRWNAGAFNGGTITFARPHPHAIRRFLISFPTYEALVLTFDQSSGTYRTEVLAIGGPDHRETSPHPMRVSADLFAELSGLLKSTTEALHETRVVDYLNFVSPGSEARENQTPFLTGMSKIAPSDVKFLLLQEQELSVTTEGRVDDVSVFFDYALPLPGGNRRFRSLLLCGFAKAAGTGAWKIDRWSFAKQPPFWLAGLTELQSSEHFSIYLRPGIIPRHNLLETQNLLEQAYGRLLANEHLKLDPSYVAFLIDRPEDFLFLTNRDAQRYHGAASTSYTIEEDRYLNLNGAMFLNEPLFRPDATRESGELPLQTITHELAHLALAPDTRHFTPPWLSEGIAVNLARQLSADSSRALIETGSLPILSLSALSRGDLSGAHMSGQAILNFEYIYAGEAVAYIIRTYGEKRFFDYYRSFASITPAQIEALAMEQSISSEGSAASIPKIMHQLTLELTRRQFGISLYDMDAVVRANILMKSNNL